MRARAALEVARGECGRSVIVRLRSDGPIVLRPTPGASDPGGEVWSSPCDAVRVRRAAAAAGPLGGDDLRLDIRVDAGASLVLGDVSASLVLPGPHGKRSHMGITARVESGGWLGLLSEPVIAARGCDHRMTTDVELGSGAGLVVREELLLGRHGEEPGSIGQRLRVCCEGRVVYDQEIRLGANTPGWRGPAVTGGRRAVGSVLLVGIGVGSAGGVQGGLPPDTALMEMGADVAVVTAVAGDSLTLRRRLDAVGLTLFRAPVTRPSDELLLAASPGAPSRSGRGGS